MAKIIVTEFVSFDDVMEDPAGADDFKYGGWTFELRLESDDFRLEESMESDAQINGRPRRRRNSPPS